MKPAGTTPELNCKPEPRCRRKASSLELHHSSDLISASAFQILTSEGWKETNDLPLTTVPGTEPLPPAANGNEAGGPL